MTNEPATQVRTLSKSEVEEQFLMLRNAYAWDQGHAENDPALGWIDTLRDLALQGAADTNHAQNTRHDLFAAAALQGILACFRDYAADKGTLEGRVELAFRYADAAIAAERGRK